jgi:hypothetical protein
VSEVRIFLGAQEHPALRVLPAYFYDLAAARTGMSGGRNTSLIATHQLDYEALLSKHAGGET